jgi:hypothetical protein
MTDKDDGLQTPQYWRERAREARALAAMVQDRAAKEGIGRTAKMYEDLATHAKETTGSTAGHAGKAR